MVAVAGVVNYCVKYADLSAAEKDDLDYYMSIIVPLWFELSSVEKQSYLDNFCASTPEKQADAGWPWPFNMISDWLNGLWNWVGEATVNAVSVVSGWISGAVKSMSDFVSTSVKWVWDQVKPGLEGISKAVGDISAWFTVKAKEFLKDPVGSLAASFTWVVDQVSAALEPVADWIVDSGKWVWDQASEGFSSVSTWISDGLVSLGARISSGLSDLWTAINGVVSNVSAAVSTGLTDLWSSLSGLAGDLLAGVSGALGSGFQGFMGWFMSGIQGLAVTLGNSLKATMDALSRVLSPIILGFVDSLRESFTTGSPDKKTKEAVDKLVKQTQDRMLEELKQAYKSPFDPATVIATAMGVAGLVLTAQVGVHGLTSAAGIEILGTRIDLTNVVESAVETMGLNRIVGSTFLMPLDVGLFVALRYSYNQMFTPYIPPVQDLIRFVVREVITPEEFAETMPYHGFSAKWASAYWDAHWVLPAFGNLVDAFHRGVIPEDDLQKFLVWHDYSPTPRPGTSKSDLEIMRGVLKTLIPRVDLRYAWEMGRISDEELVEWYRRLGYEEDSELMAEIQMVRALTEELGKVRTEWISDFIGGFIGEDTLRANLGALDLSPARVDYYVAYAVKRRDRDNKKDLLNVYRDGYLKDLVTDEDLAARAAEILVDPEALQIYLDAAYVRKYMRPKAS